MSSASNLNRLSSSSNGPHKNQTDPTTTTTNTSHLPKKPSLSSNNSSSINPHTNLLNTNPNSTSSPNPLHSKRTTPTLGGFPNLSSQSPSSPNSLGFGKSSFQTFGRIGDHSQPPSPGVFNNNSNNTNSNVKKAFQQLTQQQTTGNQTFQNNSTHRPRKLGSFNSLAANSTANNNTLSRGLAAGTKNNQEEKDSEENEIEDRSDNQRDPIHPTLDSSIPQHKLRAKWVFWLLHRPPSRKISEEEYGKAMKRLGSCDTVESFYSLYLHIKRPSNQQPVSDLHFFVDPIKPAWEDPLNVGGGKWTIRLKKGLANRLWETLIFSLVGGGLEKLISNSDSESLDEKEDRENREICGAVLSIRRDEDILAVWHKTGSPEVGSDGKMAKQVKLSLQTVLQLPLNCHLAYKLNADCLSSSAPVNTNNNMQPNTYNQHQHHHNHHHHQQHQHQQGPLNKATGHHANHSLSHHHKQANRNSGLGHLGESKTGNTHSFSAGFGSLGSANGSATVTGDASVAEK